MADHCIPIAQRTIKVAAVWVAFHATTSALAFQPPEEQFDGKTLEALQELAGTAGQLDWDDELPHFQRTIKNIWERYEWRDESDRFARDLAMEVTAIPPWKPMQRFEALFNGVERRYDVTGPNRIRFCRSVIRETADLLLHHTDLIVGQTREWIEYRANRRPITPELVARWFEQGAPLMEHMAESVNRVSAELMVGLEPEARRRLQRDLNRYHKRQKTIDEMAKRWARGEWRPEDWGLQDDPIQHPTANVDQPGRTPAPRSASIEPSRRNGPAVTPVPYDPATWHAYVTTFEQRFRLDPGQRLSASSIHTELVERASRYLSGHAEALQAVPKAERDSHEAYAPVRSLYQELLDRLDAIPTSAQRNVD